MINKAIFSYWNPNRVDQGFNSLSDFLYTIAMAVNVAKKHFNEVELITDDWGKSLLIDKVKIHFTSVNTCLQDLTDKGVSHYFWGYSKIVAYASQKTPFIHIDNDVLLWDGIPGKLLNKDLIFQSFETFAMPEYGWYKPLVEKFIWMPVKPMPILGNMVIDHTYNCGVMGANNLDIIKEWISCSENYLFSKENQEYLFDKNRDLLIHQNLLHEQYFISCLIKKNDLRNKVGVLFEERDIRKIDFTKPYKYTHLWGLSKKDKVIISRVKKRLKEDFPAQYLNIKYYEESLKKNK